MIQLKYSVKTSALKEMEDMLEGFSLAFKTVIQPDLEQPVLQDGKCIVSGSENIKTYLDQLVLEVLASRNAAC